VVLATGIAAERALGRLAVVVAAIVLLAPHARATDWYVATTGSDSNLGTSPSQPWRTIQRAVNEPVAPGDTVHVADGTYAGWATDVAGTPDAPITWIADGSNVVIDRPPSSGPGNPEDNIRLMYADWNVIDGFRSIGAPRGGIAVRGDDVTPIVGCIVRNCVCDANQTWGIFDAFANGCTYEGNTCSNSVEEHGIYHSNSGDDGVIRGNLLFGNRGCGLHMNGDESMGGDGVISRMLVERNVIRDVGRGGGGAINMDGVQDSTIRNNLIVDAHASGIIGYRIDAADAAKDNVICFNTVIMASDGRWALKLVDGSTGCTVFGNVLYRDHSFRGSLSVDAASLPGLLSDGNVVVDRFSVDADSTKISLAQWQAYSGQDTSSILITPGELDTYFVDPAGGDWHLEDGAPAVDAAPAALGAAAAPREDFEGARRPAGAGYDVGCDERPSDCPASWRNYGAGWPGTAGIPAFASSADPVLGTTIDLDVGNSAGVDTVAVIFAGLSAASLPTSWDGTLLVAPSWVVPIALPAACARR
jgi:parallel beta-helix repeat protein